MRFEFLLLFQGSKYGYIRAYIYIYKHVYIYMDSSL